MAPDRRLLLLVSASVLVLAACLMALLLIPTLPRWPFFVILCAAALVAAWGLAGAIGRRGKEETSPAPRKESGPVERLAGGVAHDLNNILLVVRGYADLALAEKGTAPEVGDHLRELITGLRRASDLVGQLFAVARRSPRPSFLSISTRQSSTPLGRGSSRSPRAPG